MSINMNTDELLSYFNLDKKQFKTLLDNGLPHYKIGNSLRFSVSDVASFLEENFRTLLPHSELTQYLIDTGLKINDLWDEQTLLKTFSISIEDLALACYFGAESITLDGKKYFNKHEFLKMVSQNTLSKDPSPTFSLSSESSSEEKNEKHQINFPCFITDAAFNDSLSSYRCAVTVLESYNNIGHFSFNGSMSAGGSAYAEIIALYRVFQLIEEEKISSGSILTDQKRFVQFWYDNDDSVLDFIKAKTYLSDIADYMIKFRDKYKENFFVSHIGDNTTDEYEDTFNEAYLNSHKLCQSSERCFSDESLNLKLENYSLKEDFISLVSMSTKNENHFYLTCLPKNEKDDSQRVELWDLAKDKKSEINLPSSPSPLHALLIASTNYLNYNPVAKISVCLDSINLATLETIIDKKSRSKQEKVIFKHFTNLTTKNVCFINENNEELFQNIPA